MPFINKDTTLSDMLLDIQTRLNRLESQKSFNIPYLNTDPLYPKDGDMWINTSVGAHGRLYIRANGANQAIYNF